jgi:hypothetical protein
VVMFVKVHETKCNVGRDCAHTVNTSQCSLNIDMFSQLGSIYSQ